MTISLKSDASGNSGSIQVNGVDVMSFGPGLPLSNRNKIINGAFGINQRAYVSGAATTAGQYTLDRWKVTGTQGITFATVANKTTVTIPSGQTLQQVIEGLNLQTGMYVLSWEGTAQGRIAGGAYGTSGSVIASITGGTNTTVEFNAGTASNVQLEIGAVATPFEHRSYGVELAMCQRYYEYPLLPGLGTVGAALTDGQITGVFRVNKRATPTISLYPGKTLSNCVIEIGTAYRTPSSLNPSASPVGFILFTSGVSYAAAFRPLQLDLTILQADAEL